jgi:hypothetical protein
MSKVFRTADRVELYVWGDAEPYTLSGLKEMLEAAGASKKNAYQRAVAVFEEFERRQRILGTVYPFELNDEAIRCRDVTDTASPYLYCVALSELQDEHIDADVRGEMFELLAMQAAESFFGGKGIRIGAPWKNEETPEYTDLLLRVTSLIRELGPPVVDAAPGGGDGGWDVIIVKNFADDDISRFIAIGNCASAITNWHHKWKETAATYFWDFFRHKPTSAWIEFFAVPFVIDDDMRKRKCDTRTVTFDRLRIAEHAPTLDARSQDWLENVRTKATEVPLV